MKTQNCGLMPLFALALLALLPRAVYALDERAVIRIGGTGGATGGMKTLAAAFSKTHPEVDVVFTPSLGSSGGIKAVLQGSLDLGLSVRPLSEAEIQKGAIATAYARTPFVFVTSHRTEPVDFDLRSFASVYAGHLRTWPDGSPIRVVMRPESEASTQDVMKMSPEMAEAVRHALLQDGMITAITDQDNLDMIETAQGSLGVAPLAQVIAEQRAVQVLSVGGVDPSLETLANGTYPYAKTFFLVTGPRPSAAARSFIEFVQSPEGSAILAQTGHLAWTPKR